MNIKHLFSLFLIGTISLASCSEENEIKGGTTDGTETTTGSDRQEVLISLKNQLVLQKPETKATDEPIATDEENYIHSLDVYVFGAKEETGTYTLQEIHYYRDDASTLTLPNVNCFSFNLTNDADHSDVTTGLLKLNKGLFVKLYCVANRSEMYTTTVDGTTRFVDFKSLQQTKPGLTDNVITAGSPSEDNFKKLHIKLIDPAATNPTENDILASPLPMSGAYTTPLDLTDFGSSARTQISFKLSRMVARFDIVNDAAKSKFTLEKISMGNGQKGAKFFPIETVGTKAADLIVYPDREVSAKTQQKADEATGTTDLTKGAFYSFPSPKDDKGFLMLKGKYAVNQTESKEVSYQIAFQQMVNGIGTYIEVAYNHRYTISITGADPYHLDFNLKVADWDEMETIDPYEPENDFDRKANVVLETAADASVGSYVLTNGQISVLPVETSKFAFKMGSNTDLKHELIYKSATAVKWLVADGDPVVTKANSQETTYKYKVDKDAMAAAADGNKKLEEVIIRLTNPASSNRKEIKVIPTPGPTVTLVEQEDNYNTFDASKLTAYIYNIDGQNIKLNVATETRLKDPTKPEGETVTGSTVLVGTTDPVWLSSSSNVDEESGEYTLTVNGAGTAGSNNMVDFTSSASHAVTTVKVLLKDPAITPLEAGSFKSDRVDNLFDPTGNAGSPQVSLVGVLNNNFTLTVVSPEDVAVEEAEDCKTWLTINSVTSEKNATTGKKKTTITGTITNAADMLTTAKDNGAFTITNKVKTTEVINVKVITTIPKQAEVSISSSYTGWNTFAGNAATLYNAAGQSITVKTDVPTTLTRKENSDMLEFDSETGTEHTITLATAQSLPLSTTPTLKFTTADGATTDVTVTLVDPAITALGVSNFHNGTGSNNFDDATASGTGNAKVTMEDPTSTNSFTLTVSSKEGFTIGDETSGWLKVSTEDTATEHGSYTTTVTVAIVQTTDLGTAINDGKIVLKNKITDGGDLTIDVVTTVTPAAP